MADSRIPKDVNDAVYRVVHEFGVERLAARTGTAAGTIYNKALATDSGHHKPTLADALIWSQITGDLRIAHAFCHTLGGVFIEIDHLKRHSDDALLDLVLRTEVEHGDFARALQAALADGRISAQDYEDLHREAYEAISAFLELLSRLEGMSHG